MNIFFLKIIKMYPQFDVIKIQYCIFYEANLVHNTYFDMIRLTIYVHQNIRTADVSAA